ncbi:hypothetical protein [Kitasatospora sp. DSM 101779]|uniref:hypothetical protein n=1 Tax=Kitasatospora sp. DSM 101779 TaxID=2853165 RepID=UPI0021D9F893|nr:hypothetical protein [Kitasatospora sp. DSM 101779]MCU7825510.1 hypothetical protein [Kitasatospora sp. DSM 101779]
MTAIAVTGHLDLSERTVPLVREELRALLAAHRPTRLTGLSCLAPGADSLFAEEVLAAGGRLVAVLPSPRYRRWLAEPDRPRFDRLLAAAAGAVVLPYREQSDTAYQAANAELLRRADLVVAVWDGRPGRGLGGTADMVATARRAGVPVRVVWPNGSARASA